MQNNNEVLKMNEQILKLRKLYKSKDFINNNLYLEDDLGVNFVDGETIFKVWSPISTKIILNIYSYGHVKEQEKPDMTFEMHKEDKGVFVYTFKGSLFDKYYTYTVYNEMYDGLEVVDPYAKGAGKDGVRGLIVDFSKTNPQGWEKIKPHPIDRKSLIIYESHISDLTSSETWNGSEENRLKYKGFFESGTTYKAHRRIVKTGFDHIVELGVNAVQLLPIFDQENDETNLQEYNWGYNPLNYNVLEGKYSSDPYDGYTRIKEFKELVKAYHDKGINIIMDVVYNHVNGAVKSNFDVLMPGYYFRYKRNGNLSNGSDCGNETASDMPMMRKFIVDSCKFWMQEYKLGGFRFDLMGIHDIQTMKMVSKECKKIFSKVYICGEPWTGGPSPLFYKKAAIQQNAKQFQGFSSFNDQFRDALIKGGLSSDTDLGWVNCDQNELTNEDKKRLVDGIRGCTYLGLDDQVDDPNKVTLYVTCHDNYTLFDRMKAANILVNEDIARSQCLLANSVIFTSQATSFILAGEEMFRTKYGEDNSYKSSYLVNEMDYELKAKYFDTFKIYKKLIALKKKNYLLHLPKGKNTLININFSKDNSLISYQLVGKNKIYYIFHKNGVGNSSYVDLSNYKLYLSTGDKKKILTAQTEIKAFETLIVYQTK